VTPEERLEGAVDCIILTALAGDRDVGRDEALEVAARLLRGEMPRDFTESVWRHNLAVNGLLTTP